MKKTLTNKVHNERERAALLRLLDAEISKFFVSSEVPTNGAKPRAHKLGTNIQYNCSHVNKHGVVINISVDGK